MEARIWKQKKQLKKLKMRGEDEIEFVNKCWEPFILTLLICGIPIVKENGLLNVLSWTFMLLIQSSCFITLLITCACLIEVYLNFYLFTLLTKIMIFISWCSLYVKRRDYASLLRLLSILQEKTKCTAKSHSVILGRIGITLLILIVFAPTVKSVIQDIAPLYHKEPTCHEFWVPMTFSEHIAYQFCIQTMRQYANCGISYAATLFYCIYCIELGTRIKFFHRALVNHHTFTTKEIQDIYGIIVSSITKLEELSSLTMLFVMFQYLVEIFRAFTMFFATPLGKQNTSQLFSPFLRFTFTAVFFLFLIFSADWVQKHFDILRKLVLTRLETSSEQQLHVRFRKHLVISEDKDFVKLTAWGFVEIKRTLFLTAVASLITYGVLLKQISNTRNMTK